MTDHTQGASSRTATDATPLSQLISFATTLARTSAELSENYGDSPDTQNAFHGIVNFLTQAMDHLPEEENLHPNTPTSNKTTVTRGFCGLPVGTPLLTVNSGFNGEDVLEQVSAFLACADSIVAPLAQEVEPKIGDHLYAAAHLIETADALLQTVISSRLFEGGGDSERRT